MARYDGHFFTLENRVEDTIGCVVNDLRVLSKTRVFAATINNSPHPALEALKAVRIVSIAASILIVSILTQRDGF